VPHLNETLRKIKAYYLIWKNTYFGKNTYFSENFRRFLCEKLCIQNPGPHGINHPVSLKVNYRSQELRWLARVGMFFAKRVFLVQTIKHVLHHVQ